MVYQYDNEQTIDGVFATKYLEYGGSGSGNAKSGTLNVWMELRESLSPSSFQHQRDLQVSVRNAEPTQTFFIPMPENDVFYDMFRKINDHKDDSGRYVVRGKMVSLVSLAVSTDKTVIWYDHWEDEFEDNVRNPKAASTEVWGDGDASNGCRPDIPNCSDEDDYLNAGDSFVITSDMAGA